MWLPTEPDALGNRENTSGTRFVMPKLKFEKDLVDGSLEYVRNVRALDVLTRPIRIAL